MTFQKIFQIIDGELCEIYIVHKPVSDHFNAEVMFQTELVEILPKPDDPGNKVLRQ